MGVRRLAVGNGPNIFQMLLVILLYSRCTDAGDPIYSSIYAVYFITTHHARPVAGSLTTLRTQTPSWHINNPSVALKGVYR